MHRAPALLGMPNADPCAAPFRGPAETWVSRRSHACRRPKPRGTAAFVVVGAFSAPTVAVRSTLSVGAEAPVPSRGDLRISMPSSEGKNQWVRRWSYVMAPTSRPGIWKLKDGGYFVRVRVTDPRTGRRVQYARALRGLTVTIWDAIRVRDQLRHEGGERVEGIRSLPPWSEYAASLFEAKVAEGKLSSSKSRERWGNVLTRLIPVSGACAPTRCGPPTSSRGATTSLAGSVTACRRRASATRKRTRSSSSRR